MQGMDEILPPGSDPRDPYVKDIDAVAFAMERVQTHLCWIAEHLATFLVTRESDSRSAEQELKYLAESTRQALASSERLSELLLAGYSVNPNKRLPRFPRLPEPPEPGK